MNTMSETSSTNELHISFNQSKLAKNEWDYIEIPIQGKEKDILEYIIDGFYNTNKVLFPFVSLKEYLHISDSLYKDAEPFILNTHMPEYIEQLLRILHLYNTVFNYNINIEQRDSLFYKIKTLYKDYDVDFDNSTFIYKKPGYANIKKKDSIRIKNTFDVNNNANTSSKHFINNDNIFEFVCIKHIINILLHIFYDIGNNIPYDHKKICITPTTMNKKLERIHKRLNLQNNDFNTNSLRNGLFRSFNDFNDTIIDKLYGLIKLINEYTHTNNNNPDDGLIAGLTHIIAIYIASNINDKNLTYNIGSWIENNTIINSYPIYKLYEHQKQIFNIFNGSQQYNKKNNFIYYCAPTGTGKTVTPLVIAKKYKIIFVCAARHIGLTFARNAISCGYKIALAFNCNDTEDIRLHFSAAKSYTKNYKSGGIYKVDNTIGDNVEIIVSDVKSYIYAAYYMKAFNDVNTIITFWDEPTISLDYDDHYIHSIIHKNWCHNTIPNMIFSSATLPPYEKIKSVSDQFSKKFDCNVHYIKTHDFNKSICLYDLSSEISSPHVFFKKTNASYEHTNAIITTIKNDKTLLRYLHTESCVDFIRYYTKKSVLEKMCGDNTIKWYDLTPMDIKELYIRILDNMNEYEREILFKSEFPLELTHKYYNSNIYFLTKDAHTLTNGSSIFLTNDVFKIAMFCFQQLNIKKDELKQIYDSIEYNNIINKKISMLEKQISDQENKTSTIDKEEDKEKYKYNDINILQDKIERLRKCIKNINIDNIYIPNSSANLLKYETYKTINKSPMRSYYNEKLKPFTTSICDADIIRLVSIPDLDDTWKLLLICGIGIVSEKMPNEYNTLINEFAADNKLLMFIASSDYIYGTNYSFHHGYIGKDMINISRQKLIQAVGRIGRGKLDQHYSIRLRDDEFINILFDETRNNDIEAINMVKLLCFDDDSNHSVNNHNVSGGSINNIYYNTNENSINNIVNIQDTCSDWGELYKSMSVDIINDIK
jgi:hypothetical protein